MRPVKIVVVGAGSASFGLTSLATLLREPGLRGSTLALVDRNEAGLGQIHQLAERMAREWGTGIAIESGTGTEAMLDGADFVVCSIEVGPREELWRQDWEISRRHGVRQPYAENGGPGGFFHAARNIPHILDIAAAMERRCPGALFVNLTNPLPRLCRAITKYTSVPVVGLCHQIGYGYGMTGRLLADEIGVEIPAIVADPDTPHDRAYYRKLRPYRERLHEVLDIKAAGLNHFTWMLDVRDRRTGADLYPLLRQRVLEDPQQRDPLTRDMLRVSGWVPVPGDGHLSEYLPYTHNPVSRPWERYRIHLYDWDRAARERNDMWVLIERLLAEDTEELEELRSLGSEGVYEVVQGVAHDANMYWEAVNVPNQGAITNLPAETIVEVPAVLSAQGVVPLRMGNLPPIAAELCRREAELVELVVEATVTGSREVALQALSLDPVVDDLDAARAMLDDYLETHRKNLPQFHGKWRWERDQLSLGAAAD